MLLWHYYRYYNGYQPVGHTTCMNNEPNLTLKIVASIFHIQSRLNVNFALLDRINIKIPKSNLEIYQDEHQQCKENLYLKASDQNSDIYILLYSNNNDLLTSIKNHFTNIKSDPEMVDKIKPWYQPPNNILYGFNETNDNLLWNLYQIDIDRPSSPLGISIIE